MPFRSKAQRRYFYWAESHGQLPPGTAAEWESVTQKDKKLPERVKGKRVAKVKVAELLVKAALANESPELSMDFTEEETLMLEAFNRARVKNAIAQFGVRKTEL